MTKSPFLGMDPYLETHWRDVHTRVMTYVCDQIQDQLPQDLVARVEESVAVDCEGGWRSIAPDVRVVEDFEDAAFETQAAAVAVAEPLLELEEVPQIVRHVRIFDLTSRERLVTAIEVLSPTNKLSPEGREDYIRKQQEYLDAGVNLVELDLLRCGQHVLAIDWKTIPVSKRRPYMMCVRSRLKTRLFGASLREPLPVIPIPLRPRDREASLALQPIMNLVYDRGRYSKLSYQTDPDPPFSAEDAAWADTLLKEQGRRS